MKNKLYLLLLVLCILIVFFGVVFGVRKDKAEPEAVPSPEVTMPPSPSPETPPPMEAVQVTVVEYSPRRLEINSLIAQAEIKVDDIEATLSSAASNESLTKASADIYLVWDGLLNELWSMLQNELEQDKLTALFDEQLAWIAEKEAAIQGTVDEYSDNTTIGYAGNNVAASMTRERVYQLAEYFE